VSALHEADNVSILFEQPSSSGRNGKAGRNSSSSPKEDVIDDRDSIRAHAEKVLYWANRASERSKKRGGTTGGGGGGGGATIAGSSSIASARTAIGDNVIAAEESPMMQQSAPSPSPSPIPTTIGLPPRSQSRVRRSRHQLPPRCPPASHPPHAAVVAPSSSSSTATTTTTTTTTTASPSSSPSSSSDKENGGGFNAGAFPKFPRMHKQQRQQKHRNKKSVSVSDDADTIIRDVERREGEGTTAEEDFPMLPYCCECTASPFSGNDPQSEFYLPKLGLACACGRNGGDADRDRADFSKDPTALSNVLRPWQCDFLSTIGVSTADGLLRAHRDDANGMARKMRDWRAANAERTESTARGGDEMRSRECYVALKIWSRTCKVVLRSIREQRERAGIGEVEGGDCEGGAVIIERPHFLDISFADAHTITSISTLGQYSSVCGTGRPFEMMEI